MKIPLCLASSIHSMLHSYWHPYTLCCTRTDIHTLYVALVLTSIHSMLHSYWHPQTNKRTEQHRHLKCQKPTQPEDLWQAHNTTASMANHRCTDKQTNHWLSAYMPLSPISGQRHTKLATAMTDTTLKNARLLTITKSDHKQTKKT